ncbi:MAG: DUF3881 family protein [Lachnospiraceae bacterium]|nr:DUF3881 family protein [Lachnospiraceae bacterium]
MIVLHKYMRAIGFSKVTDKEGLKEVLTEAVKEHNSCVASEVEDQVHLINLSKNFSPSLGVAVCGDYRTENHFVCDYYYPFLQSYIKSVDEEIRVERHASQNSYAGMCEEVNFGIILIFYLQNQTAYFQAKKRHDLTNYYISLTGLSVSGKILLPIEKNVVQRKSEREQAHKRTKLLREAREGNEDAIETLTVEDMNTYNAICQLIQHEDLYSIVDTSFIPSGVESDHYTVLGEIMDCRKEQNIYTGEEINILTLNSNDITMEVAINTLDLMGEPAVGRRFKGEVWLQGTVHIVH